MNETDNPTPNDPAQAYPRILRFVQGCLYKRSEASPESVAQSIFVSLAGNHEALLRLLAERPDEVMPLILRIAQRHVWKHNQRTRRRPDTMSLDAPIGGAATDRGFDPVGDTPPPEAEVEFLDAYDKFVGELSGDEQKVLRLLIAGHTADQIASQLGVARRTVERYIKRIKDKLLAWLQGLDGDVDQSP